MPNGLEILGGSMRQIGSDLGAFSDRQRQYEEMVQRRVAVLQEQKRQEEMQRMQAAEESRRAAEFEQKKHAAELQQQEADRQQKAMADFRKYQTEGERKEVKPASSAPYAGPVQSPIPFMNQGPQGAGPNGETAMNIPAEFEQVRPTREQLQQKAMETGAYSDPGVRAYFNDTDPTKTPEFMERMLGLKTDAQTKVAALRQQYQAAAEEYRQGRIDARSLMGIRAAMERAELSDKSKPKTASGMPLKALGDTELKGLKDIQNTAYSIQKIRGLADNITGLKRGPIAGRIFGKNPYDTELQALDRLVNQTVPGMARGVFGEVGVLTDDDVNRYKGMLASVKDDPKLAGVILDELEEKINSAYRISVETYDMGGRDVSGFDPNWNSKVPSSPRAPKPTPPTLDAAIQQSVDGIKEGPKAGDTKTNSAGDRVRFNGKIWVRA